MEFDTYALVLLRWPSDAPVMFDDELDALQERHLAHLDAMKAQGDLLVAGPFSDQPDEAWRGMCLYGTSLERARELAERDPSVVAGRLTVDVFTWRTQKGAVSFG